MANKFSITGITFCVIQILFFISHAQAQIQTDASLGVESTKVLQNQNVNQQTVDLITGGAQRGTTLFQSFQKFNVLANQSVYFANPASVQNIISRVSGSQSSQILGRLGVLGTANLYFINPNGIVFGPNSSLDVGGSFIASTARSVAFSSGFVYSTANPNSPPLVSFDAPIGLDFGLPVGSIVVSGSGGTVLSETVAPVPANTTLPLGLNVPQAKTLALIGGKFLLEGGVLTAPSGQIEIGGVSQGRVGVEATPNMRFIYPPFQLQDIVLEHGSILNASGSSSGHIRVTGDNVRFQNSLALIENQGVRPGGLIQIRAQGTLTFIGDTPGGQTPASSSIRRFSGILSQTFIGDGASVLLEGKDINFLDNATIYLASYGVGVSGNLSINAQAVRFSTPPNFLLFGNYGSTVSTFSAGSGGSGNLLINTDSLSMDGASTLTTTTFGVGRGGDILINAKNEIILRGYNPQSFFPTVISASTLGSAEGGTLRINTNNLSVLDGARIDASSLQGGKSGNVNINALTIIVRGSTTGAPNPSLIISSANQIDPNLAGLLGLINPQNSESGSVIINARDLIVDRGAQITVRNDSLFGQAGDLQVRADRVTITSGGSVTATTNGGDGGGINLNVGRLFFLDTGFISSTSSRLGSAGNISITSPLIAVRNSLIAANAQQAPGGRVQINAQGLFLDRNTVISASSGLGPEFNGPVRIESQTNEIIRPTQPEIALAQPVLEEICQPTGSNNLNLTIQAFGGAIVSPTQSQSSQPSWGNTTTNPTGKLSQQHAHNQAAVSWRNNPDGTVDFINATQYIQDVRQGVCGKPTP
jgi:filamentous hemagglutinin family protein